MCDYSLCGIPNRLAVEGEVLVVHRFSTQSIGLTSPADLLPRVREASSNEGFWRRLQRRLSSALDSPQNVKAVCIPPGSTLILNQIPRELRRQWSVEEQEQVTFLQMSADANTYRDAISFRNGRCVLLQNLTEGIPVKVISLGGNVEEPVDVANSRPLFV